VVNYLVGVSPKINSGFYLNAKSITPFSVYGEMQLGRHATPDGKKVVQNVAQFSQIPAL
jgi:hypothetical protein